MCFRKFLLFSVLFSAVYAASAPKMSVAEIRAEFDRFKKQFPQDETPFESFAAQMDSVQKVDSRFEAYKGKPELYPVMPREWVDAAYQEFKKADRTSKLTIAEFGWSADCEEGGARHREAYKDHFADLVILYGFMGVDKAPFAEVYVVEQHPGFIKLISKSGQTIAHSGRYSVVN